MNRRNLFKMLTGAIVASALQLKLQEVPDSWVLEAKPLASACINPAYLHGMERIWGRSATDCLPKFGDWNTSVKFYHFPPGDPLHEMPQFMLDLINGGILWFSDDHASLHWKRGEDSGTQELPLPDNQHGFVFVCEPEGLDHWCRIGFMCPTFFYVSYTLRCLPFA